jgi:Zn-dependent peptidase ImmA (M78 family)
VDVYAVARDQGLTVIEQDLEEDVSGFLLIRNGRGIIGVNKHHHLNRQRFTIAHECGHYLLHRGDEGQVFIDDAPVYFRDSTSSDGTLANERQANAFAAELLMPEAEVRERVQARKTDAFDDLALRRLATYFGVSVQALTIRLVRLNLINAWE